MKGNYVLITDDEKPDTLKNLRETHTVCTPGSCTITYEKVPDGLLEEWQKRLGLTDWRIKLVDNCEPEDMSLRDVAGSTEWTESVKTARIEIMDPKFYGDRIVPFDYEKTLVHELLHLKFSLISLDTSDLQARVVHQIIDDLARAFVDAKRSEKKETIC